MALKNLGGCGAILLFGGLVGLALGYWGAVSPTLDPAAAASLGRCLLLVILGMFAVTGVVVCAAPMGKGRR